MENESPRCRIVVGFYAYQPSVIVNLFRLWSSSCSSSREDTTGWASVGLEPVIPVEHELWSVYEA